MEQDQDNLFNAILILRCQRRDEKAFRELVNRWETRLYYYLRRIVENENAVWDILQETWLAVFKGIRKLQDHRKFPAWLYQIAHNKAVSWLRKENKYVEITDEQMANHCENNTECSFVSEHAGVVHSLLGKLKLAHREVLTLYYLEGFSITQMVQIIGVSQGTVKSRLHYAKKKLHDALKGADNE